MKLPTCTGQVSVHFYPSDALVLDRQSCQPRSKGGNLALAAPQTWVLLHQPCSPVCASCWDAVSYQGSWCESPSLWVSLEVPQKDISFGQDIGVVHC